MKKAIFETRNFLSFPFTGILIFLSFVSFSQAPDWEWAQSAGGVSYDRGNALTFCTDGSILVTGYFQGTATFDTITLTSALGIDAFIAKYSTSGSVLWAKSAASSATSIEPEKIYEDSAGNIYLTGSFGYYSEFGGGGDINFDEVTSFTTWGNQDQFVAKYNSSGNFDWARHIGSDESDRAVSTMDNDGHIILSGILWSTVYFNSTIDTLFPYHLFDLFIAGYDTAGMLLFYRNAASCTAVIEPRDITTDNEDNIYLAGSYNGKPTFGLPVDSVDLAADVYYNEGFIAKYDPLIGDNKWAFPAGDTMSPDNPYTLSSTGDGKLLMSGTYLYNATFGTLPDTINLTAPPAAGYGECYLVQYDTSGNADWAINAGHATAGGLNFKDAFYNTGHYYISGDYSAGPAIFGQSPDEVTVTSLHAFFVADYDDYGNLDWINYAGGFYYEGAESVTADTLNNVYIAGFYLEGCSFPGTDIDLTSTGFEDIMLARLDDNTVSISENSINPDCFIYPNPAIGIVTINLLNEGEVRTIQLINLQGEVLLSTKTNTRQFQIDLSGYSKGPYIITVMDDSGNMMTQMIFRL
jgi:hypothetical protein